MLPLQNSCIVVVEEKEMEAYTQLLFPVTQTTRGPVALYQEKTGLSPLCIPSLACTHKRTSLTRPEHAYVFTGLPDLGCLQVKSGDLAKSHRVIWVQILNFDSSLRIFSLPFCELVSLLSLLLLLFTDI